MASSNKHMDIPYGRTESDMTKENYLTWYRENVVLKRVVEMVSDMFRQEMNYWNKNFTQDNKTNINNMVEDLMKESDELIEEDEHFLGRCIMDIFDDYINIEVWISKQEHYEERKNKGKKKVEWIAKSR